MGSKPSKPSLNNLRFCIMNRNPFPIHIQKLMIILKTE